MAVAGRYDVCLDGVVGRVGPASKTASHRSVVRHDARKTDATSFTKVLSFRGARRSGPLDESERIVHAVLLRGATLLTTKTVGHWIGVACLVAWAGAVVGCNQSLDAGYDRPHGLLPVDERNPIVLVNDGAYDNWSGEYAVLLANGGGPALAGIVVNASTPWPDLQTNVAGWTDLVAAARSSGLRNLPDPIASAESPLVMPSSGEIDATQPNRSAGALFILDTSRRLGSLYRPLVIATGGGLTDVADAYLVDPTVTERVVVVSALGSLTASGGSMGSPNGDEDPWADTIVAQRFHYVQVSAFYDQTAVVPSSMMSALPGNAFGAWIASKAPNIWKWPPASDQVSVLAPGLPTFATAVERVSPDTVVDAGSTAGLALLPTSGGPGWLVTGCDGGAATTRFWQLLTAAP